MLVRPFFLEYFEEHTQCRNKSLNSHTVNFFVGMNVIRPTAMASIHTDPTLAANSLKTAERAKNILSKYKGSINVVRNCEAIFAVATGTTEAVEARLAQVSCSSALPTPPRVLGGRHSLARNHDNSRGRCVEVSMLLLM